MRLLYSPIAISTRKLRTVTIVMQFSLLPLDCVARTSGQDRQQIRTRGLTKINQHENSTVHTNITVVSWVENVNNINKLSTRNQQVHLKICEFITLETSYVSYIFRSQQVAETCRRRKASLMQSIHIASYAFAGFILIMSYQYMFMNYFKVTIH